MSRIEDLEYELTRARWDADRYRRQRNEAQVEAAKLGEANNQLCDDIAEAGERIRVLEEALAWFAERHSDNLVSVVGQTKARAALLGMDGDDWEAVQQAWTERKGRAA